MIERFDIKEYLSEKKKMIEKSLERELEAYGYPHKLSEAMKYGVMNGGKRIRPVMMYAVCDLFNRDYNRIEKTAIALEFIHCYSLIHDDLPAMDNDMYRRGKLTVHAKYNEAVGILTGDALLTEAFNIISKDENLEACKKVDIIGKLAEYAGFCGMIGGQFMDMESEGSGGDYETLKYIHSNKTGKLLRASIELALIALGISGEKYEKLVEYSEILGLVFQMKDDVLDIEGDFAKTGKKSNDEENEKLTYPKFFGMKKTKEILNEKTEEAKKIIVENFDGNEIFLDLVNFFANREG